MHEAGKLKISPKQLLISIKYDLLILFHIDVFHIDLHQFSRVENVHLKYAFEFDPFIYFYTFMNFWIRREIYDCGIL